MTELQQLAEHKTKLNTERDLCCELGNAWLTRLHDSEDDEDKYELYTRLIADLEEYSQIVKSEVVEINKRICEILNVDSIEDTEYAHTCQSKYGLDKPNV
jgi:hypothetical protein